MYKIYANDSLLYAPNMIGEGFSVLNPKLTMEINKGGSLEFQIPPNNPMYDKLPKLKTIIKLFQDGKQIWKGRILHDKKDFYKRKHIYCEGQLSFLNDAVVHPYDFAGTPAQLFGRLLGEYNSQVEDEKKLVNSTVTVTDANDYIVRSNINYPSVYDEMVEKLVNVLGGYLVIKQASTYDYIQYLAEFGDYSDQVIQFGKNLLDISEYIDASNVFTVLIPLGAKQENEDGSEGKRLTIESVNDGKDYLENQTGISLFGRIVKVQEWNDVTIASNLKSKGKEFLDAGINMSITLTIKAVDLHLIDVDTSAIKLGDFIRVLSIPHGLDQYFQCTKLQVDLVSPDNSVFTLGSGFSALTDQQVSTMKRSKTAYSVAESAQSTASSVSATVVGDYIRKSEFLTFQNQVNSKLTAVYHYKGTSPNYESLPTSGNSVGDVWNDDQTGANYAWTGKEWDKLSETIDLSGYVSKIQFDELVRRIEALENPTDPSDEIIEEGTGE